MLVYKKCLIFRILQRLERQHMCFKSILFMSVDGKGIHLSVWLSLFLYPPTPTPPCECSPHPPLPPGPTYFSSHLTRRKHIPPHTRFYGAGIREVRPWLNVPLQGRIQVSSEPLLRSRVFLGVEVCTHTPMTSLSPILPQSGVNSGLVRAKDSITSLKEKTTRVNQHVQTLQV